MKSSVPASSNLNLASNTTSYHIHKHTVGTQAGGWVLSRALPNIPPQLRTKESGWLAQGSPGVQLTSDRSPVRPSYFCFPQTYKCACCFLHMLVCLDLYSEGDNIPAFISEFRVPGVTLGGADPMETGWASVTKSLIIVNSTHLHSCLMPLYFPDSTSQHSLTC